MPQPLGDRFGARRRVTTIVALDLLTGLGPFTIDLHLPTSPAPKTDLGITDSQAQMTLSATTLGFALGQFVVGPLSDQLGRRIPLIVTASLHVTSSVLVAVAPNVTFLITMRVLQGTGTAGRAVVSMAMARDLSSEWRLVVMLSRLALINGLAPIIILLVGSWVVTIVNWRGAFWASANYGAVLLVLILFLTVETHPPGERTAGGLAPPRTVYRRVPGDRAFVDIRLTASCCFAGLSSYISTSSLLLQEALRLRETEFDIVFAICSIGAFTGVQLGNRLSAHLGPQKMLIVGAAGMITAASTLLGPDAMRGGHIPLIPAMFVYTPAFGAYSPAAQMLALQNHRADSGVAASLMGAPNVTLAAVVEPVIGQFKLTSAAPMAIAMFCYATAAALCLQLIAWPRRIEFTL